MAARSTAELGALAYTLGPDIVFSQGRFAPESAAGGLLLAHELVHVAQQSSPGGGRLAGSGPHERDAEYGAARLSRRLPIGPIRGIGKFQLQLAPDPRSLAEFLASPPAATMSASLYGLRFLTPGAVFVAGPKVRQAVAIVLRRLLDTAYKPELVDQAIAAVGLKYESGLAGDTTGGERIVGIGIQTAIATRILEWIRKPGMGLEPQITPDQERLLKLGMVLPEAYKQVVELLRAKGTPLPAWYRREVFVLEAGSQGELLEKFAAANTQPGATTASTQSVASDLADALLTPALVLEAVRADPKCAMTPGYQVFLWPRPQQDTKRPLPPAMAGPAQVPDAEAAAAFLAFIRTQPDLMDASLTDPESRLKLLGRFENFYLRVVGALSGDQKLLSRPATANAPPWDAELSSYPELQAPLFDASLKADMVFDMHLMFPTVLDAFASYGYVWTMIKIPPEQVKSAKVPAGAAAAAKTGPDLPANPARSAVGSGVSGDAKIAADKMQGEAPSWAKVYQQRLGRTLDYTVEDLKKELWVIVTQLGPPGISATLALLPILLRPIGVILSTFFEQLTKPDSEAHFTFPEEGLYLIRCAAVPSPPAGAAVIRPASVAYKPVFARDPAYMAESRVALGLQSWDAAQTRLAALKAKQNKTPEEVQDQEELTARWGSVAAATDYQVKVLNDELTKIKARYNWVEGMPKVPEMEKLEKALERAIRTKEHRDDRKLGPSDRIIANFVSDTGQVVELLIEVVDESAVKGQAPFVFHISDSTTSGSGQGEGRADSAREALRLAVKDVLEGSTAYGRGQVSYAAIPGTHLAQLVGPTAFPLRIAASDATLMMEAAGDLSTVLAIIAVVGAPFTGGASLVLLIPAGVVGAVPSAYRLWKRGTDKTLDFDLETAMDIVNIIGAFVGLGEVAVGAKLASMGAAAATSRLVFLSKGLLITGVGAGGLGVLFMGASLYEQIKATADLPPGLRAAAITEILGQAMVQAGIMIGAHLVSRARLGDAEQAFKKGERTFPEWQRTLDTETVQKTPTSVWEVFTTFTSRVRELLTLCESSCFPADATKEQGRRIENALKKLNATAEDQRYLQRFFHDNMEELEKAIKKVEGYGDDVRAVRRSLRSTYTKGEIVLTAFKNLRERPALRAQVDTILGTGHATIEQLGKIMDNAQAQGVGGERLLGYIEKLLTTRASPPEGFRGILGELEAGHNFMVGAEWVLEWIDDNGQWKNVEAFEVPAPEATDAGRRWDAVIGKRRFQFKSWKAFYSETFVRQVIEDYAGSRQFRTAADVVRWEFDYGKLGKSPEWVRGEMASALDNALEAKHPKLTSEIVAGVKARLEIMVPDKP